MGKVPEIRTVLDILEVMSRLAQQGATTTVGDLCETTTLSRGAVERAMQILARCDLIHKGRRAFGRPVRFVLSERGLAAVDHLRRLERLLATEVDRVNCRFRTTVDTQ